MTQGNQLGQDMPSTASTTLWAFNKPASLLLSFLSVSLSLLPCKLRKATDVCALPINTEMGN